MRVGGDSVIPVDIRILAATNQNLEQLAAERQFREDLLYRLDVLRINIPSLNQRREDISLLADSYMLSLIHISVFRHVSPCHCQ